MPTRTKGVDPFIGAQGCGPRLAVDTSMIDLATEKGSNGQRSSMLLERCRSGTEASSLSTWFANSSSMTEGDSLANDQRFSISPDECQNGMAKESSQLIVNSRRSAPCKCRWSWYCLSTRSRSTANLLGPHRTLCEVASSYGTRRLDEFERIAMEEVLAGISD